MVDIGFANNAKSRLRAGISSIQTDLTILSGDGIRFPSANGVNSYFYATITRASDGAREIIKCTYKVVDSFETIVRAQGGTTALAFAADDTIHLSLTAEGFEEKIQQEAAVQAFPMQANYDGTGIPTIVYTSKRYHAFVPSAAAPLALPSTGILKGDVFVLINLATTFEYGVRVNASDSTQVTFCPAASYAPIPVEVEALQDTPTTASHWAVLRPPKGILIADEVNQTIAITSDGFSVTLPADLLYADGAALKLRVALKGNGAGTQFDIVFDGTTLDVIAGSSTFPLVYWADIIRRGAASQYFRGQVLHLSADGDEATPTKDLTGTLVLKIYNSSGTATFDQELVTLELV